MSRKNNPFQRIREEHITQISKWISEAGGWEKINTESLIQKICLLQGATRQKAIEYLEILNSQVGI